MLVNTRAIVLHQTKFNDTSVILHLYTEKFGRVPVLVFGLSGKKGKKAGLFQPLFLIDAVIYNKPGREVQKMREYQLNPPLMFLTTDIRKSGMALFLADVLYHCLREEANDASLFSFLESSVQALDAIYENTHLFHIVFLTKFMRFMGFAPEQNHDSAMYFDLKTGHPSAQKPVHGLFLSPIEYQKLTTFYNIAYHDLGSIAMTNLEKEKILSALITLYELHLIHFKSFKSFEVLQQVFGD